MNSPRMRRFGKLLLVVFALACVLTTAAFAEGDAEVVSAVHGTIASLLPPVVAIGLALITKEVFSSLFLVSWLAASCRSTAIPSTRSSSLSATCAPMPAATWVS